MKKPTGLETLLYWRPIVLAVLVALVLAWPALTSVRESFVQAHRFQLTDSEAMATEVIERLAQTGTYAGWSGAVFAPTLPVGPAVIVPSALLAKVTGMPGAQAGRAWIVLLHLLTLGLVARMGWRMAYPHWGRHGRLISAVAALAFFEGAWRGFPGADSSLFAVHGEGAVTFFMVAAVSGLFHKAGTRVRWTTPSWTGILASLAALSKPAAVVLPVALALWALWRLRRDGVRAGILLAGLLAPWTLWKFWMLGSIGIAGTREYWSFWPQAIGALSGSIGWPVAIGMLKPSGVLLALAGFAGLWRARRAFPAAPALIGFALVQTLVLLWIAPETQSRALLPLVVLAWIAFVPTLLEPMLLGLRSAIPDQLFDPPAQLRAVSGALAAALLAMFAQVGLAWRDDQANPISCAFCRQLAVQAFWRTAAASGRKPSALWSTGRGPAADSDLVLSAPHEARAFPVATDQGGPRQGWILVGESPQDGTIEYLQKFGYRPVFAFPGTQVGIWTIEASSP